MSIDRVLFQIYQMDKTPSYGYSETKKDKTKEEEAPGTGKRWLTPREIIRNYFGVEFWDKYKKWKEAK